MKKHYCGKERIDKTVVAGVIAAFFPEKDFKVCAGVAILPQIAMTVNMAHHRSFTRKVSFLEGQEIN